MRAQLYEDGVKRINAKIEVPMSVDDVATYILSAVSSRSTNTAQVQKLNKRQLLALAKEQIELCGVNEPRSQAEHAEMEDDIIVRNYVKQMFPELL